MAAASADAADAADEAPAEKMHLVVLGGWEEGSAEVYDDVKRCWVSV